MTVNVPPVYHEIDKIDAHMHLNAERRCLPEVATEHHFHLVSINTEAGEFPSLQDQAGMVARCQKKADNLHVVTTFSTKKWGEKFWQDEAIEQIKTGLHSGAVAVKIWKNIGMELQDKAGNFIMIDDPSFDPILSFLEENGIPLLAHVGEPKNCWLPLEEMTVRSDREYFAGHPQFHMYKHKACPTYRQQLEARDAMLHKHPDLVFIGAHLASLEWSVDELAGWLDTFPNAAVDLAERVCHLQHQASAHPGKVKEFVGQYQERIIYGSDQIDDGTKDEKEIKKEVSTKWRQEFSFFAAEDMQRAWNVERPFKGLGLSKNTLKKIFRHNAEKWYPRLAAQL